MTPTVALNAITKQYRAALAVCEVSFALPAGETVALVGHNGAGKTTLLKLMLGLIRPTTGSISVLGQDAATGDDTVRRRLGFLPENVAFNAALTGREILSFYARLKGIVPHAAMPLLERVGLADASHRRIGTYSKGMRQRLGLAQALLGAPRLLLLDEPTTGLDPALRQTFYEIVQELRDAGATVILSSHALTEIEERADRVLIMNRGRLVANGAIDALRQIACLPTRIRIRSRPGAEACFDIFARRAEARRVNGHVLEIEAMPDEKMNILRAASADSAAVEDVEVLAPTLDQLYAHFLRSQVPA